MRIFIVVEIWSGQAINESKHSAYENGMKKIQSI